MDEEGGFASLPIANQMPAVALGPISRASFFPACRIYVEDAFLTV